MNLLLYGLQRSGTNLLESLLRKNYRGRILNKNKTRSSPLQKHYRLYDNKDIIPEPQYRNNLILPSYTDFERVTGSNTDNILIISKDPYSWLLSYRNWATRCGWPEVDYHYIEEYNLFYGKWLKYSKETSKIIFIRYIDILEDAEKELSRLQSEIGLKRRIFYPFMSQTLKRRVPQSRKFSRLRRDYYLQEEYLKDYRSDELHQINRLLDENVISQLGYQIQS